MKGIPLLGATHQISHLITKADLAPTHHSGNLPVLATPALVAFMEEAAHQMLLPYMAEDEGTVGTRMEIDHTKASLLGWEVQIEATLTAIEGRQFVFEIKASDSIGTVGLAKHSRFLITPSRFLEKLKNSNV